jgi:uncharacterized membrane protein YbaN (DUF454 family)
MASSRTKRWLKLGLGWTFVILGVAGLVLPFLQGILFLAIGFGILSQESAWARDRLDWLRQRYPESAKTFDQAAERTQAWLRRLNNRRRGEADPLA